MATLGTGSDIQIIGWEKLQATLKALPLKLELKYVDAAIKAASKVVVQEAKTRLRAQQKPRDHVRAGKIKRKEKTPLWKTIGSVIRKRRGRHRTLGVVGPRYEKGGGNHGHLVERGHVLFAWGKATGKRVRPYPFLEPALKAKQSEVIQIVRSKVRQFVNEANK